MVEKSVEKQKKRKNIPYTELNYDLIK